MYIYNELIQSGLDGAAYESVSCSPAVNAFDSTCCFELYALTGKRSIESLLDGVAARESLPYQPSYVKDEGQSGDWQIVSNDPVEFPATSSSRKCALHQRALSGNIDPLHIPFDHKRKLS